MIFLKLCFRLISTESIKVDIRVDIVGWIVLSNPRFHLLFIPGNPGMDYYYFYIKICHESLEL